MSAVSAGAMGALTGNNSNNGNNSINSTIGGLGIGGFTNNNVLNSPGNIAGNAMTQAQQAAQQAQGMPNQGSASFAGNFSTALANSVLNSPGNIAGNQGSSSITGSVSSALGGRMIPKLFGGGYKKSKSSLADTAGVGNVDPQVQAGGFSPDTSIAAEGIFGSEQVRGIQPYKKPLINF